MFAFAVYDRSARRLVLGRDRAGKKPLYYAVHRGFLVFASEIKALHASNLLPKAIDPQAFECYLAHGFVAGERTLFAEVRKLPAGCILIATAWGHHVQRYWDVPLPEAPGARENGHAPSFEAGATRVRELLEEAAVSYTHLTLPTN